MGNIQMMGIMGPTNLCVCFHVNSNRCVDSMLSVYRALQSQEFKIVRDKTKYISFVAVAVYFFDINFSYYRIPFVYLFFSSTCGGAKNLRMIKILFS